MNSILKNTCIHFNGSSQQGYFGVTIQYFLILISWPCRRVQNSSSTNQVFLGESTFEVIYQGLYKLSASLVKILKWHIGLV